MKAINRGFFLSAAVSAAVVFAISRSTSTTGGRRAVLIGLILASVIQVLTQYFTDTKYKPVQEIAESTVTGPATTILSGFSTGLESTVWSALIIAGDRRPRSTWATPRRAAVLHLPHRHGDAHDRRGDRLDGHVRSRLG